jgi:hypothetical protein
MLLVIGLMGIVRMAVGAVDVLVAVVGGIGDAAGAVDGLAAVGGIVGAAALAGADTRNPLPRIQADKT